MKLSRNKAIELCIEVWTWCAETGGDKRDWPEWDKYGDDIRNHCWFCQYDEQFDDTCHDCPFKKKLGMGCGHRNCSYGEWDRARTPKDKKKYAKLLLEQIKKCK